MAKQHVLADRRARLVLAAMVASGAANSLLPVAESFAVLRLTGSATRLGLLLACQAAVTVALSLAGGLAGDRLSRRLHR